MSATLSTADITTDHAAYAARRSETFSRLVPLRRERRVRVGDTLTLEFENSESLTLQVQEMVYTERLTDPGEVAHEVDAYTRMLPGSHELCATMFLELDDPATVKATLRRLDGIQHSVSLLVGDAVVTAVELPGLDEDPELPSETVSVHTLRFRFTDATRDAFRDPAVPVEVAVDHPAYSESVPLAESTRRALIADLTLAG